MNSAALKRWSLTARWAPWSRKTPKMTSPHLTVVKMRCQKVYFRRIEYWKCASPFFHPKLSRYSWNNSLEHSILVVIPWNLESSAVASEMIVFAKMISEPWSRLALTLLSKSLIPWFPLPRIIKDVIDHEDSLPLIWIKIKILKMLI